jgi:hypothetical protein
MPKPEEMTLPEIVDAVARISDAMRGPMNNVERRWLHADRQELRAELRRRAGLGSDPIEKRGEE